MPVYAGEVDKCVVLGYIRAVLPKKRARRSEAMQL